MSSEKPTPRTDAAVTEFEYETVMLGGEIGGGMKETIDPDFARELERELIESEARRNELIAVLKVIATTVYTSNGDGTESDNVPNYELREIARKALVGISAIAKAEGSAR